MFTVELCNLLLPIQIGARDVSFPRLNLLSWYCYVFGAVLAVVAIFSGNGPPDTGWTFYVPFSTQTTTNVNLAVSAAFMIGFSSILTGINFVTTIHRLRCKGMGWGKLPLFVWTLYSTAWIQILATPMLAITLVLVFPINNCLLIFSKEKKKVVRQLFMQVNRLEV